MKSRFVRRFRVVTWNSHPTAVFVIVPKGESDKAVLRRNDGDVGAVAPASSRENLTRLVESLNDNS